MEPPGISGDFAAKAQLEHRPQGVGGGLEKGVADPRTYP